MVVPWGKLAPGGSTIVWHRWSVGVVTILAINRKAKKFNCLGWFLSSLSAQRLSLRQAWTLDLSSCVFLSVKIDNPLCIHINACFIYHRLPRNHCNRLLRGATRRHSNLTVCGLTKPSLCVFLWYADYVVTVQGFCIPGLGAKVFCEGRSDKTC